jgi:hypothetical protein
MSQRPPPDVGADTSALDNVVDERGAGAGDACAEWAYREVARGRSR